MIFGYGYGVQVDRWEAWMNTRPLGICFHSALLDKVGD